MDDPARAHLVTVLVSGAAEQQWSSHLPATGASTRALASPTVKIQPDVSLELFQHEEALYGAVTRSLVSVRPTAVHRGWGCS